MRTLVSIIAAAAFLITSCGAPVNTATASPAPATPPPATPILASPTAPSPDDLTADTVARVTADTLALSESPGADSDPAGSLPRDSVVFVAAARDLDGATWLQLLPLNPGGGPESGWAAANADSDGALERCELGCDSIGVDAALVAAMSPGLALACYAKPFTIEAWIVDCNCDLDGGYVDPEWLGTTSVPNPSTGRPAIALLVNPGSPVPGDSSNRLIVHLDPAGDHPDPLPFEQDVLMTGAFDHPAAETCKAPPDVEVGVPPDPVFYCRTQFAITAIRPAP